MKILLDWPMVSWVLYEVSGNFGIKYYIDGDGGFPRGLHKLERTLVYIFNMHARYALVVPQ